MLRRRLGLGLVVALLRISRASGQVYEVVNRAPGFTSGGPTGRLLLMTDGSFVAALSSGGEFGKGLIFRLVPNGQGGYTESDVHSFTGADGATPQGGLIFGAGGFVYGTTLAGGASDSGTIFRLDRSGRLTRLHDFGDGGGAKPSVLFAAPDGNIYGTTQVGGAHGQGTAFRIDSSGVLTTLHDFGDTGDGSTPTGGMLRASNGNLWGTTSAGGAHGFGTIFRIDGAGGYATMHSFEGTATDGFIPTGSLVEASGSLFGTTATNAHFPVFGTVFRLDAAGSPTTLHVFDTSTGGAPIDGLAVGLDGNIYGSTRYYQDPEPPGGLAEATYAPVFYAFDPFGTFQPLHAFTGGGTWPLFGLLAAPDGNLYGWGLGIASESIGAFVRLTTLGGVTALHNVSRERWIAGYEISSPLLETADGSLYGAAEGLAFFRVDPEGTRSVFNYYNDIDHPATNGLIQGSDQNFYATVRGFPGRFLKFDADGHRTTVCNFDFSVTGGGPWGVTQLADGYFYGPAEAGGPSNLGTIFRLDTSGGAISLHDFVLEEGFNLAGDLLLASDGSFYGMTRDGGENDLGTIFRFELGTGLTSLHSFTSVEGAHPQGRLIEGSDGYLYGTTQQGGANGFGTIFRTDLDGHVTPLHDATKQLSANLVERSDGYFYGSDGLYDPGGSRVFKMDTGGNVTTVHPFIDPEFCLRNGLRLAENGDLLGTTTAPLGAGVIFRISDSASAPELAKVEPSSGLAAGGASVDVRGHHFADGASVTFGGMPGIDVRVDRESLITAIVPPLPPGTIQDVVLGNALGDLPTLPGGWFSDFLDVSGNHTFHDFVEAVFRSGITAGCGSGNYCPDNAVTRAQMAVFLLKAKYGAAYTPPGCHGIFDDVTCPSSFADWIEQLAAEEITAGCGGDDYCPGSAVTRAQMAVFLLKTEHGSGYTPPACAGVFNDVPCSSTFAPWIEQLAAEGVAAGCGGGNYCPQSPNTRGQMAVFLTRTFDLGE